MLSKLKGHKIIGGRHEDFSPAPGDFKSRIFLFFCVLLLFANFMLIFSDSIGIISPNINFGDFGSLVTWIVFLLGFFITLFCVPVLYYSSYKKFEKEDEFWDMEVFWILPLSFFGIFFQYVSNLPYMVFSIPTSLIIIFIMHVWMTILSKDLLMKSDEYEKNSRYYVSFAYLTAYYLLSVAVVVFFNLFDKMRYWFV